MENREIDLKIRNSSIWKLKKKKINSVVQRRLRFSVISCRNKKRRRKNWKEKAIEDEKNVKNFSQISSVECVHVINFPVVFSLWPFNWWNVFVFNMRTSWKLSTFLYVKKKIRQSKVHKKSKLSFFRLPLFLHDYLSLLLARKRRCAGTSMGSLLYVFIVLTCTLSN